MGQELGLDVPYWAATRGESILIKQIGSPGRFLWFISCVSSAIKTSLWYDPNCVSLFYPLGGWKGKIGYAKIRNNLEIEKKSARYFKKYLADCMEWRIWGLLAVTCQDTSSGQTDRMAFCDFGMTVVPVAPLLYRYSVNHISSVSISTFMFIFHRLSLDDGLSSADVLNGL